MVERDRLELERALFGDQLVEAGRVGHGRVAVGHPDHVLEGRQPRADRGDLVATVDVAVAVAVAGDREHQLRLDLREPVDHAARAELGRARRPDRTEARRRDERHERLGNVGQVGDDAVPGADAEALQARARAPRHFAKPAECQLRRRPRLRLGDDGDRVTVLVAPHEVLGVVEARALKPLRAGHRAPPEHMRVGRVGADLVELPDRGPEPLEVVDGPALQRFIGAQLQPAPIVEPVHQPPHLGGLPQIRGRGPEHVSDHQRSEA